MIQESLPSNRLKGIRFMAPCSPFKLLTLKTLPASYENEPIS